MAETAAPGELGLSIIGLGTQYPPHTITSKRLEILSKRFYPDTPAMQKVLSINRFTGIDTRSSIGNIDHPVVNGPTAPTIAELHKVFISDGVPLAVSAARQALDEAHLAPSQITHMVSTTCTNSANPGFDHFVARDLGLSSSLEKVLLHGVGCSGGLAALRTAANLCLGHSMRGLPARILVVALEISTTLVRSELDSIHATQQTRIGAALFSDCASAVVLSNSLGDPTPSPVYSLLGWQHQTIPDTESDLGFDADPSGWKVILTPRVPVLTQAVLQPAYAALLASLPTPPPPAYASPADYDWALHPGGATILTGAEKALSITPEHMRASYDTYVRHGNSSSATVLSVLNRLRHKDMDGLAPDGRGPRDRVIAAAFGPGITVETAMLRRNLARTGLQTPPDSEVASDDGLSAVGDSGAQPSPPSPPAARLERPEDRGGAAFVEEALENPELD